MGDTDKKNFPYFDIVDRVLGDRDVISNKHVVDLGVTAVREAEKRQRRVVSVLSEKQNMKNENMVPKGDSESPKSISESDAEETCSLPSASKARNT